MTDSPLSFSKAYEPPEVEERLYARWQEKKYFVADPKSKKAARKENCFSIVMPPPNVTGKLTLGHVLNNTLQDILARQARLEGKEVLWLPGTDHAGLATQNMVEKDALAKEKISRDQLRQQGRAKMLERIWIWQKEFGGIITRQLRKIGASCDWSRERFTLDDDYARTVQQAFIDLHQAGFIYRGTRMINWCPVSLTALSDEEVIPTKQNGFLYYVKYELVDKPGTYLVVATTRPETIMADVALAIKPGGKWSSYVGKKVWRPLHKEQIPIIEDIAVEEGFGTGVLKVTPHHDKVDYQIWERNRGLISLGMTILTPQAKVDCPAEPELHGLDRFEARKRSAEILQERGLLEKEEPYENTVGFSERANVPIEPMLSQQWFLRYPKINEALELVQQGHVSFYPSHWVKVYEHWLENIQDWCISRQIWWGHRIPVWYKVATTEDGYKELVDQKYQLASPGPEWVQDEDCLDTWFSSWLWAYATMREEDGTRKKFYPTSVLVTGPDIIFLWVARMLIAGLQFQPAGDKKNPVKNLEANLAFKDVYFTGLIRDKQGRKLSKSLGNSPDPLEIIAKYGADGVRFGLVRIAPQGQDIRFDEKQVEEGRNFCNKLWNIARFRALQGPINAAADPFSLPRTLFADELLARLHHLLESDRGVVQALKKYEFSEAAGLLYAFVWNDFASRFVEAAKVDFASENSPTRAGTLATFDYVMSHVLRLLHPFVPFVTEELWCELGFGAETIQFTPWPRTSPLPKEWTSRAADLYATADAGRTLRGEIKLPTNQKVPFFLELNTVAVASAPMTQEQTSVLTSFLNASELVLLSAPPTDPGPVTFTPLGKLSLPATGLVDPSLERDRLSKELVKVAKDLDQTRRKLGDAGMLAKAPAAKLAEWRALEVSLAEKEKSLQTQLEKLR